MNGITVYSQKVDKLPTNVHQSWRSHRKEFISALIISDFYTMIDGSTVFFALSVFAILSLIIFYISTVLRNFKTDDGKPIISLFLKELGSKTHVENLAASSSLDVSKESELPDGWFINDQIFNLEKRAIFSKVSKGNAGGTSLTIGRHGFA